MKHLVSLLFAASLALSSLFAGAVAPIDINAADAAMIESTLVGVGPKTAKAIVDYRAKNGPFKSVNDLEKVKGVGAKLIEKNRNNILVK